MIASFCGGLIIGLVLGGAGGWALARRSRRARRVSGVSLGYTALYTGDSGRPGFGHVGTLQECAALIETDHVAEGPS